MPAFQKMSVPPRIGGTSVALEGKIQASGPCPCSQRLGLDCLLCVVLDTGVRQSFGKGNPVSRVRLEEALSCDRDASRKIDSTLEDTLVYILMAGGLERG